MVLRQNALVRPRKGAVKALEVGVRGGSGSEWRIFQSPFVVRYKPSDSILTRRALYKAPTACL